MRRSISSRLLLLALPLASSCVSSARADLSPPSPVAGRFAIAIHGGAGTIERTAPAAQLAAYRASMHAALTVGRDRLARGDAALDVCEAVARMLEDDPLFNAGKGAAFNEKGEHELDASIMAGHTLACGAVAGVRTVKNPISLARRVMEQTRHVLLMGDGAEDFASAMGVERVPNTYFDTEHRRRMLEEALRERAPRGAHVEGLAEAAHNLYGTVGCVALDQRGNLAAATSTGGLTAKKYGRVGDAPIIGAGNYADRFVAVSGTGTGEEFIRHNVARTVAARVQFAGQTLAVAANAVVFHTLKKDDGGIIAVDRAGNLVAVFNSEGMYRGLADSSGRFDVRIFED